MLKNGKMANFMLYISYNNKKNRILVDFNLHNINESENCRVAEVWIAHFIYALYNLYITSIYLRLKQSFILVVKNIY